jgi:hypothetical protein
MAKLLSFIFLALLLVSVVSKIRQRPHNDDKSKLQLVQTLKCQDFNHDCKKTEPPSDGCLWLAGNDFGWCVFKAPDATIRNGFKL